MFLLGLGSPLEWVNPSRWSGFWRHGSRKTGPDLRASEIDRRMARDIMRLAETSPHLLADIGFEKVIPKSTPQQSRWRLRRLSPVELTEIHDIRPVIAPGGR